MSNHRSLSIFAIILFLLQSWLAFGQTEIESKYRLLIKKAVGEIKLDGVLDESDWELADVTTPFWQQFPFDTSYAKQQSEVRFTFDDENIYVSYVVSQPKQYVVQSLKRDFPQGGGTDLVIINFDTFKDKQNAFHFAISPYGVQREGLLSNGSVVSNDWDNKWKVEVTNEVDRWIVEASIPFKTLRYKVVPGENTWNIHLFRNNLLINERSSWTPMQRGFPGNSIAFGGTLVWDTPPPKPGANISLIPYVISSVDKDYLNDKPSLFGRGVGMDAKVGVSASLNLDLTVNPDFAQVEVDQQVTNLSRFELFFPERRQFFLENADLFGNFGFSRVNPFFSRRIGLLTSPVTGFTEKNAILAGARLSGKINNKLRVGLLNMQTERDERLGLQSNNFTVGVIQQRLFTSSNISVIIVNKQNSDRYNRTLGLEYNLASANGRWSGKAFHQQLFTGSDLDGQYSQGFRMEYSSPIFGVETQLENVGANYRPEVGFVPRRNYVRNSSSSSYRYYPRGRLSKYINSFGLTPDWDLFYGKKEERILDGDAALFGSISFQNNARITCAFFRMDYTYLFGDFDPSGKNDATSSLKAGTDYLYMSNRIGFQTNNAKRIYATGDLRFGEYFNGTISNASITANMRTQPYALFGLGMSYNRIRLPEGFNNSDLWIISPRIDLTMTRSLFITGLSQYNNQTNNMNLNIRCQWRFKPASDFFLVYADNYFTEDFTSAEGRFFNAFQSKNRALVMKCNYWFNI
jgi:hypothetical protein